jgi:hypothetical protein
VVLHRANHELERQGYLTHEFGDSVLIEREVRREQEVLKEALAA